jgi:murein DD-endopeptidase MepM/ murein hydrolase activator NlpD
MHAVLDAAPPLNVTSLSDPRLNRRAINRRWLAATVVLAGTAAFLMLGALYVAFDRKIHFTAAAAVFLRSGIAQIRETIDGRGDRLDPVRPVVMTAPSQVHIAQLDVPGIPAGPLTHLAAHLGPAMQAPMVASSIARRVAPVMRSATPPSAQQGEFLPPEIMFGNSHDRHAAPASADAPLGYTEPADSRPLGEPVNMTVMPEAPFRHDEVQRIIVAKAGDTLSLILRALGTSQPACDAIAAQFAGWQWGKPGTFAGGEKMTVETSDDDASALLRPLRVIIERQWSDPAAVALSDAGDYTSMIVPARAEIADPELPGPAANRGASPDIGPDESIRDNLYALAEANNVDRSLIDELIRLCGRDVDLDAPASADDAVELLYGADDSGQPQLTYIDLKVDGRAHRYYRFTAPDDGSTDYYDASGHSVTKFLLRKPVTSGRLGDGFGWRTHPILHDRRFHKGVDYAAPFGSPVAAAGAGVVEKIDQEWGYGKYIRVRHDQGYETTYAHVSGFPKSIRVGTRVHQGETIAYIGSTGLSTGPHLYYEVRINGENVDPLRIRLAAGRLLGGEALAAFRRQCEKLDQAMTHPPA